MSRVETIHDRIKILVEKYADGKNTVFAGLIGSNEGSIRGYLKGVMPKQDILENIVRSLDVNAEWLITGEGSIEKTTQPISESNIMPIDFASVIDTVEVPITEIYAAAGYGAINLNHMENLGSIRLPANMLNRGTHYCIRVQGHSMTPTIQDSDYVIVRLLDRSEWENMPDEHVYLVVDTDGAAYMKRVKNRFQKGFIVCMSDSIEKNVYPNFNLQADQIVNIFHAEWHFSAKMQNINETYYSRLKFVEDDLADLKESIKRIK